METLLAISRQAPGFGSAKSEEFYERKQCFRRLCRSMPAGKDSVPQQETAAEAGPMIPAGVVAFGQFDRSLGCLLAEHLLGTVAIAEKRRQAWGLPRWD